MKIYTKTGDSGETGVFAGPRVSKDSPRIEAYGTVDELNSMLGLARCEALPPECDATLLRVQDELFVLGSELACPDPSSHSIATIGAAHVEQLEHDIDAQQALVKPLRQFILPGGTPAAALLHVARTVCRRAERRAVTLAHLPEANLSPQVIVYLNRLSDLLFVMARRVNAAAGQPDHLWPRGPR